MARKPLTKLGIKKRNKQLQRDLNQFFEDWLDGFAPLIVDGDKGYSTNKRIVQAKYYLGYVNKRRDSRVDEEFLFRLTHPRRKTKTQTEAALKRGKRRRRKQRKLYKDMKHRLANAQGFGTFEGMTVAAWMVPILQKTRAYKGRLGRWQGRVTSGVRTPEYSEQLCFNMCGAPSCPGRCAGRTSNHNMTKDQGNPNGAVDVSDYVRFGQIQKEIGSPLVNRLGARDPVHFSVSGR